MNRDKEYPLTPQLERNLNELLLRINKFRNIYGKPMFVSSGYRPLALNKKAGGAKKSNHMSCLACDFVDSDGLLDSYCITHLDVLKDCGLYLEHPKWTKGWCHLEIIPPPISGNRVFIPSNQEPTKDKLDLKFLKL